MASLPPLPPIVVKHQINEINKYKGIFSGGKDDLAPEEAEITVMFANHIQQLRRS